MVSKDWSKIVARNEMMKTCPDPTHAMPVNANAGGGNKASARVFLGSSRADMGHGDEGHEPGE